MNLKDLQWTAQLNNYTLLYYPDFQPDPVWLRKILLLADNVTRIVPHVALREDLRDPDDLLALQDSIPGCLSAISPEEDDLSVESENMPHLKKAFALLAQSQRGQAKREVKFIVSNDGSVSIAGHVFLHPTKLSHFIHEELRRNALILSGLEGLSRALSGQEFIVVEETASHLILCAIAENISRRTGFDAITEKPWPFALKARNDLGRIGTRDSGGSEGAVLASLTSLLVPTEVGTLKPHDYRAIRESYAPIRSAFKELTAKLAAIHRLNRIEAPQRLRDKVEETAREYLREYEAFRKSSYARGFKSWTPLCVGGLLQIAGSIISPHLAIAGASFGFQVIQKLVDGSTGRSEQERVFNMLTGLRKDIIRRSGIKKFF